MYGLDYSRQDLFLKGIYEFKQVTKSVSGSKNNIKLIKWYIFLSHGSQPFSQIERILLFKIFLWFESKFEVYDWEKYTIFVIWPPGESAISDQLFQCESPLTFDDFDILASDSNKYKLLVNENLLIKRDKLVLSRATKSFPLDLFD